MNRLHDEVADVFLPLQERHRRYNGLTVRQWQQAETFCRAALRAGFDMPNVLPTNRLIFLQWAQTREEGVTVVVLEVLDAQPRRFDVAVHLPSGIRVFGDDIDDAQVFEILSKFMPGDP
jgi:hypothetical protein